MLLTYWLYESEVQRTPFLDSVNFPEQLMELWKPICLLYHRIIAEDITQEQMNGINAQGMVPEKRDGISWPLQGCFILFKFLHSQQRSCSLDLLLFLSLNFPTTCQLHWTRSFTWERQVFYHLCTFLSSPLHPPPSLSLFLVKAALHRHDWWTHWLVLKRNLWPIYSSQRE